MQDDWAAEHLQVIRTLMERSAVYRRALAPIMLFLGGLGLLGGVLGAVLGFGTMLSFGLFWSGVAVIAVIGAFLLARRQALRDHEPFWSPPTRRVAQAVLPPLTAGLCFALALTWSRAESVIPHFVLFPLFVLVCVFFYGCALHAAGFFMPRGMKAFGWLLIGLACAVTLVLAVLEPRSDARAWHLVMGFFFGVLHLAYGIYLCFTERRSHAV